MNENVLGFAMSIELRHEKKKHFCVGLPHAKVGFKRLIHVAPITNRLIRTSPD